MIRCNMCMEQLPDWIVACPTCNTDDYLMDIVIWTKYDYVCTNCDALIEVTAQVSPAVDPDCICGYGMVMHIGSSSGNAPIITDVTDITPSNVVKINTNPYT